MNASIHPNILLGKYYKHLKGDSQKLESNTLNAFNKMANAALKDGIKIQIAFVITVIILLVIN